MAQRGKRVGPKKKARFRPTPLLLALGVTLGVVAWGYLVKAAIDFGVEARNGDSGAWLYLGLACLGAVACLFIGLLMVARLLRVLGITQPSSAAAPPAETEPPRRASGGGGGGRRAAR
ncbi:hypothetical protein [Nocardioides coralli]|uniref:hypothetical protein n=1 Tax=Nocardioides coralli TaxID=2872154 RepID=UPI001CA3C9F2|nr:hypothetical protein [Nocardioides coralli]QZY29676.1 hypothetical protein K6T13_03005 [Nocardioides coralli]